MPIFSEKIEFHTFVFVEGGFSDFVCFFNFYQFVRFKHGMCTVKKNVKVDLETRF